MKLDDFLKVMEFKGFYFLFEVKEVAKTPCCECCSKIKEQLCGSCQELSG